MSDEVEFAKIVEALGPTWHSAYEPLAQELMTLRELAADLLARYRANPTAVGSRGQEVEHPALRQYLAVSNRALVLTEALLLSPRSRKRAGVEETCHDGNPFDFLDGDA
jgi:hypothetical protein